MPNIPLLEYHLNTGQPDHLNNTQMDSILFYYVLVQNLNGTIGHSTKTRLLNTDPLEI